MRVKRLFPGKGSALQTPCRPVSRAAALTNDGSWQQGALSSHEFPGTFSRSRMTTTNLHQKSKTTNNHHHPRRRTVRRPIFHFPRLLEVKDQVEGRAPGVPFPRGHGPSKTKKNVTGREKKRASTPQKANGWKMGGRSGAGWLETGLHWWLSACPT